MSNIKLLYLYSIVNFIAMIQIADGMGPSRSGFLEFSVRSQDCRHSDVKAAAAALVTGGWSLSHHDGVLYRDSGY
jgi:hypothetical protein